MSSLRCLCPSAIQVVGGKPTSNTDTAVRLVCPSVTRTAEPLGISPIQALRPSAAPHLWRAPYGGGKVACYKQYSRWLHRCDQAVSVAMARSLSPVYAIFVVLVMPVSQPLPRLRRLASRRPERVFAFALRLRSSAGTINVTDLYNKHCSPMYYKITIVTTRISDLHQCCYYLSNALVITTTQQRQSTFNNKNKELTKSKNSLDNSSRDKLTTLYWSNYFFSASFHSNQQ